MLLPPTPVGVPPGHSFWNAWYEQLRTLVNSATYRQHNNLTSIQGGTTNEYYHLTASEYANLGVGKVTTLTTYPTTANLAAGESRVFHNSTTSTTRLYCNIGGTLKYVALT